MFRLKSQFRCAAFVVFAVASMPAADFGACEKALLATPLERSAAECFFKADAGQTRADEALRRLENVERRYPLSGWLTFYRAMLRSRQGTADGAALYLYTSAIKKFSLSSDVVGETEARLNLGNLLFASGKRHDAWLEAPKALDAARRTKDPLLIARAILYQADLSQRTGERLGQSARLLTEAEQLVFPGGTYALKRRVLGGLGKLAYDLGRYEDARLYYSALITLARDHDDQALTAQAAYSSLTARRKQMEDLPEPERLPEFTAAARDLVMLADATGQPRLRAMAYRTLADLLWPVVENREEAEAFYRSALAHAGKASDISELTSALWALGRVLADTQPHEARRLIEEALMLAADSGNATTAAYAWRQQMRLAWKTLPRGRAAEESMRALGAIERLRTLQDPGPARAAVLAAWTPDYYWLIGALLDPQSPTRAEVRLAFEVAERMRAQLLLDSLQQAPAQATGLEGRLQRLMREISAVQRQLLDPRVQGAAREAAVTRLEGLEREEEEARVELNITRQGPRAGVPPIASLERLERALRDNEAVLSFSVGVGRNFYGDFAGGSWLLATTNASTRVINLPDRPRLHAAISIFRGLAEGSSRASISASVRLHEILLGQALQALPNTINRLIIVPDGPLHHLPFAALRPGTASSPLGSTHEIVVVPSASVWMRLLKASQVERTAVLVMADPALPDRLRGGTAAQEREWLPAMLQLGPLPHSRREGNAIMAIMGRGSRLLTGAAATESALKAEKLDSFSIVHFASHALIDELHPDRSAVLLAGDEHEDGLLQAREIRDLALDGRVVILSACRSATGAVLAGEGVLGLSRSFFEAGARTVVGTLWAVRDDQAAAFFEAFYASFGRGNSIGGAMRDARQHAIAQGIPSPVWSSFVVMGDDTVAAIPAMDSARARTEILLALVGTLVVTIAILVAVRRKAGRP